MLTEHERLEGLSRVARVLRNQETDTQTVLQNALSLIAQIVGAKHGCVVTFQKDNRVDQTFILSASGDLDSRYKLWQTLIKRGLIAFVQHSRRSIIVRDIMTDPRWPHLTDTPAYLSSGSAVGLPLEKSQNLFGVLALIHPRVDFFDDETLSWLNIVADIIALSLGSANLMTTPSTSENRYRWLFEDSVVPIITTNLDGYILDANRKACEFLKYKREQLIRMPISAIHRMGTGPIGANRFESLQEGKELAFHSLAWPSEGDDLPVYVRARRMNFEDHDVIVWVEQDLSVQMELEQLRQDLSAMVYHDLRGPLHTIYSSLSTLTKLLARETQPAVKDLLEVGIRGTRQLSRLVESLLDIQRLEAGKAVIDPKPTSLHSLLVNAVQLVQPMVSESQQSLKLQLADDLPFVTCDQDMILRVVTNLLENAVKYSPMGGQITLEVGQHQDRVQICVRDSGPGIPKHMQRQIFDKFSRVKYKDAPKGLGLGLAFCRLAVEAHGGQIWVESEPDQGSSFIFILPVQKELYPAAVRA
jgi:PAS domain S-box-containing protein